MKVSSVIGKEVFGVVLVLAVFGCTAKVTPEPIVVDKSPPVVKKETTVIEKPVPAPAVKEKETTIIEKPAPVVKEKETTVIQK